MKESAWGYGIITLGLLVLTVIMLTQNLTTTNEEDFYLGREVLSASMIDAVDLGSYRNSGKLVMSKEKFVEIFLRRFAESVSVTKTYQIDFYDIKEYPPKASEFPIIDASSTIKRVYRCLFTARTVLIIPCSSVAVK